MTPTQTYIQKARNKHGQTYSYDFVEYTRAEDKITIVCKRHGAFRQTANNHLNGQGCPTCGSEKKIQRIKATALSTKVFVKRARQIHMNKYRYSKTVYVASHKPVVVTCLLHGDFVVGRAEKHLQGQGCASCSTKGSLAEEKIAKWLAQKGVLFYKEHKFFDCRSPKSKRRLPFDFYLPNKNILIEYDGEHHKRRSPLFHKGDQFERFQQHDKIKTAFANQCGIVLVRISHTEFPLIEQRLSTLLKI